MNNPLSEHTAITGLPPHSVYQYRVNCFVQQPTEQFATG